MTQDITQKEFTLNKRRPRQKTAIVLMDEKADLGPYIP